MRDSLRRPTLILIVLAFVTGHLALLLLPEIFDAWNWRAIDRLFMLRASSSLFQLPYDGTIVHVDVNDTTVSERGFDVTHRDFGRIVDTLKAARTQHRRTISSSSRERPKAMSR